MALLAKDSGKYIKVIRDRCIFTSDAVQVFYYEFDSKKDRDEFFNRKSEVQEFLKKAHAKCLDFDSETDDIVSSALPKNEFDMGKFVFPESAIKLHNEKDQFMLDLMVVEFGWDKEEPLPKDLKSIETFKSLGFKEDWFSPLKSVQINGLVTGAFTNQTFNFSCLYRELKKVFKEDFIDC